MTLTISVISQQELAQQSCSIEESEMNIGRGRTNHLVLPDEQRVISHQHAQIRYQLGKYVLEDKSTNGTFINDDPEPVGNGNQVELHEGDKITIGQYEMICSIEENRPQIPEDSNIWQMDGLKSEQTGLLYQNEPESPYPDELEATGEIPADFDFLKPESSSIEQQFDSTPPEQEFFIPPEPQQSNVNQDKAKSQKPKQIATNLEDRPSTRKSVMQQEDAALKAFFTGLGLDMPDLNDSQSVELMTKAGKILREMTRGYTHILKNRTTIKSEFRLNVTLLAAVENNPLKFAVDTDDALNKLLFTSHKAYLPATHSIREAVVDLQSHEMAIIAGLRAALGTLVARFDPEKLEKRFQDGSILENLLPVAKKAKCWELFKEVYQEAAADAENDFLKILGKEFADAYQEQMKALKHAKMTELSNIN